MTIEVVVGLIQANNKLLICERPHGKPYSGYWEFPGGKVEPNETQFAALQRELAEELGINVLSATPQGRHLHQYPDKTVALNLWLVSSYSGVPTGKENQQIAWVSFADLSQKKLLEGNILLLDKLKL